MSSIHLIHYRNYSDTTFPLADHTVFVGPNGSGKTNVIEAIRTLSVTKSYRVNQDKDAIQWGAPYCRVELKENEDLFEYILTADESGGKKVIKHNGVTIPLTDVYGLLPTVLFSPETMQLIDGSPLERRRFLDTLLSQVDKTYLEALMIYRKVLRERHFVLLRIQSGLGNEDELDYWNKTLVEHGSTIINQRAALVDDLNNQIATIYPKFVSPGVKETLQIAYQPACQTADFTKTLKAKQGYDIKTTTTSVGPHRDELVFLVNDRNVTLFASRGELRRCVLATKLAEAAWLAQQKDQAPMLLLDDVFSELDSTRRNQLKEGIRGYRSVITTTDQAFVDQLDIPDTLIHTLSQEAHGITG